ncbi:hypothetical protein COBT_002136 [Conglomerata obtusa]
MLNLTVDQKIHTALIKWQVTKTLVHNFNDETIANIIIQLKNIFFEHINRKNNRELIFFKVADEFADLFDKYNVDVDEYSIQLFSQILCAIYDEDANGKNDTFEIIDKK